jgi:hypothetical protein
MATNEPIKVWRFQDAPQELQELSTNGGDEDWLATIPAELKDEHWVDCAMSTLYDNIASQAFGCSAIEIVDREDGSEVRIGCHS